MPLCKTVLMIYFNGKIFAGNWKGIGLLFLHLNWSERCHHNGVSCAAECGVTLEEDRIALPPGLVESHEDLGCTDFRAAEK